MAAIWSEEGRYRRWLDVELAVCEVLAARGQIPADDMTLIRERAGFDLERIEQHQLSNQQEFRIGSHVLMFIVTNVE